MWARRWDAAWKSDTVRTVLKTATIALVCFGLFGATSGAAYTIRIHEELTRRSLSDDAFLMRGQGLIVPATTAERTHFRRWLYERMINHPDVAIRTRAKNRFPTEAVFTAQALRALLAFNMDPKKHIYSIDRSHSEALSARALVVGGSSMPDRDGRNRARFAFEGNSPVLDKNGQPVPHDPSTLNMGRSEGLSSQAHAHYGLPDYEFSDDPQVLKEQPERFLLKTGFPDGPVLALAADMAQLHTDMALLAHLWGQSGSDYLFRTFAGQSFHYLEDVGNQIHTVQVGSYDFFFDAKLQYWWRALITAGGYLGPLRPFTSIGIDILTNHHALIEELTALRFYEAIAGQSGDKHIAKAVSELAMDSPEYSALLDDALASQPSPTEFARTLTKTLIEASAPEGAQAYQYMKTVGCGRLSIEGFKVPKDGVEWVISADELVCHADDDEGRSLLEALYELQARAFRRVSTSLRRYDQEFETVMKHRDRDALINEIVARFVRERLDLLDASDARRAVYIAAVTKSGSSANGGHHDPPWLYGEIGLIGVLFLWFSWRRRKRTKDLKKDVQDPDETPLLSGEST
jgi:hypothetical protein